MVDAELARARLAERLEELRKERGYRSLQEVADAIFYARPRLSELKNGRRSTRSAVLALEKLFDVPGELVRLYDAAWSTGSAVTGAEEGDDTLRRDLFTFAAAGAVAAAFHRASLARERELDVLDIGGLKSDLHSQAMRMTTTPHDILAPEVFKTYRTASTHLERTAGRVQVQRELASIAGYSGFLMGRLAFNTGDQSAWAFCGATLDLALQLDDPILTGAAYSLSSTLNFYSGSYTKALADARAGRLGAPHPYTRGRFFAWEARALAKLGDREGAINALNSLLDSPTCTAPELDASPLTTATTQMLYARTMVRIDAGDLAERAAIQSLRMFEIGDATGFEDHGGALTSLAGAYLRRPKPEVDGAVEYAERALELYRVAPTAATAIDLRELAVAMGRGKTSAAARDFREQLDADPRLAIER